MKKAFITGITGQDGSYLAEFLLEKDYEVHGIIRRASTFNTSRIDHLMGHPRLTLHHGDLADSANLNKLLRVIQPDEIYNLGAQSHVKVSFEVPEYTAQVDAVGTLRLLDAMINQCPEARFYQASTSELFGEVQEIPQRETTPFYPRSPYGVAKLYAFWITKNFRESYDLYACNGILFNHESERRGKTFVTRKITTNLAEISVGLREVLRLGNMDAKRDWGYAKEYVEAMWLMLQQEKPEDFVIATGKMYTVREFVEKAAKHVGFDIVWKGEGVDEKGYDKETGKLVVEVDPRYFRPAEVELLIGDPTKAREELGWEAKVDLDEMVKIMMENDLKEAKNKVFMHKTAKIYVAGHRGMVGSAIVRNLKENGYENIITRSSSELDLRDQAAVEDFFAQEKPEFVFLAAAKVGGIVANNTYRAEFIHDNLAIELNIIHQAYVHNVEKLLFLGSSCIYPKFAPQPMKEEDLLTGILEPTNEPYAIAKIAGIKLCEAYRDQYGCNFISCMPTNLYGQNDNYDLQKSHVLPALIRKFHEAKLEGKPSVEIWGDGSPKREFLHVDDLAEACIYLMNEYNEKEFLNIGVGEDISIKDLALTVKEVVGYEGELDFDASKTTGTPRKLMDVSRLAAAGFKARIGLKEGIEMVYQDFQDNIERYTAGEE